jgi:putative inorganic carbon (HCO3(-)) transporter
VNGDISVGGLSRQVGLVTDFISYRAIPVVLILLSGLAIARLPLTWAVALILGTGALILISVRPIVGLYFLIFAIPFGSLKEISVGVITVGGAEAMAILTIVAWMARMAARREIKTIHPPLLVPLLMFLAVICFSLVGALSLQWSLKGLLVWVELLAIYLFVVNVVDVQQAKIIVVLILLAGCLEAMLGFYQFFGRVGPEGFLLFDRFIRAYGTFEQPNPYGGYLGLILPLALSLFLARWRRRDLWSMITWALAGLSLGLMGAALLMSWSRGALLGFMAGVAVVALAGFWHRTYSDLTGGALAGLAGAGLGTLWFYSPGVGSILAPLLGGLVGLGTGLGISVALRRRWVWLLLALVVIFGVILLLLGGDRLVPATVGQRFFDFLPYLEMPDMRGVHVTDENFAVVERLAHWQAALGMLSDHPLLGVGIGNYVPVYAGYALPGWKDPLGHAHNYYLHVAAETGLLGLGAYLLLIFACFWQGWRALRGESGQRQGVVLGILGVLTAFAVHSLFDNLYVHGMNMHLAISLGLIYVLTQRCEVSPVEAS